MPGSLLSRLFSVFAVALLTAATVLPSSAQQGTGTIRGRVENAATSSALNRAQVSVVGTNIVTFTDEGGAYELSGVPAGEVTLRFFFTGLDEHQAKVTVAAGQAVQQDVTLTNRARYGEVGETLKLDEFVVASARETNAQAIAVNEQRFAGNITSVVSTEEFGTITDRNPGEFLKYLPGIDVEYFANNITGVSVRGLGSVNTEMNFDGMPTASMNAEAVGRGFEVQFANVADISRVEIRKLPLPQDSSNALGGSINLIRRSAFEYSKRKISYRALFQSDGEELTFDPMDGPKDREVARWRPNWEVSWTEPLSRDLGFSVVVGQNDTVVNTHWSLPRYNFGPSQDAAGVARNAAAEAALAAGQPFTLPSLYTPGMRNPLNHNAPLQQGKDYASVRVDWRPRPELTIGWSLSGNEGWKDVADDIRYEWDTWNGLPNTGSATRYNDPSTSLGNPGTGRTFHNSPLWRDIYNPGISTVLDVNWRKDAWTVSVKGGWSISRYNYRDTEAGFFNSTTVSGVTGLNNIAETGVGAGTANPIPLTINYYNTDYWGPKTIEALTTANGLTSTNAADYTVPVNWWSNDVIRIGGARSRPGRSKEIVSSAKTFVKRDFRLDNPLSVQLGFDYTERFRNRYYDSLAWRFVGADGVAGTADDTARHIAAVNLPARRDSEYDYPAIERISMSRLYKLYQDNPSWFQFDDARSARLTLTQNAAYDLTEEVVAPYLQGDWRLLKNRLRLIGGVRYEKSSAKARGLLTDNSAAYMKYADGTVVHVNDLDAAGNRTVTNLGSSTNVNYQLTSPSVLPTTRSGGPVFIPAIQAAGNAARAAGQTTDTNQNLGRGTMLHTQTVYRAKGATGEGENDGFFPSLHATYSLSENMDLQVGYAKTQAKLEYANVIVPSNEITDDLVTDGVGAGALGRINLRNPNLKPWTGNNFDLRVSYYTKTGGLIGLGAFTKRIKDFYDDIDTPPLTAAQATALGEEFPDSGIGPEYAGYTLRTRRNGGSARLDGVELEVRQSLDLFLPAWGRGFTFTGNSTYANRKGSNSNDLGTNRAWRHTANLMYRSGKFFGRIGYTYNGVQIENPRITSGGRVGEQIREAQHIMDLSLEYSLNNWARLFISGTNVLNELRVTEQRFAEKPSYANLSSSNTIGTTVIVGVTGDFADLPRMPWNR